jgi:PIN domain nuclease of toxin-antitoxin system
VTVTHGLALGRLPRLHGDPFDRLLVAQAKLDNLTLVTRDERLADYGVPILGA